MHEESEGESLDLSLSFPEQRIVREVGLFS